MWNYRLVQHFYKDMYVSCKRIHSYNNLWVDYPFLPQYLNLKLSFENIVTTEFPGKKLYIIDSFITTTSHKRTILG